jgi:hypothetical protein
MKRAGLSGRASRGGVAAAATVRQAAKVRVGERGIQPAVFVDRSEVVWPVALTPCVLGRLPDAGAELIDADVMRRLEVRIPAQQYVAGVHSHPGRDAKPSGG